MKIFNFILKTYLLTLVLCKCQNNPLNHNKIVSQEEVTFYYNVILDCINKIKNQNFNGSLPGKIDENKITDDIIKAKLEELISFINDNHNLLNDESDKNQLNTFDALGSLQKLLTSSAAFKKLKTTTLELADAINASSKIIKIQFERRKIFEKLLNSLKVHDKQTNDNLKKILTNDPNICLLKTENDRSILHEAVINLKTREVKLQQNISDMDEEKTEEYKLIIEKLKIIVDHILLHKSNLAQLFRIKDKSNKDFLHYAAEKNRCKEIFSILGKGNLYLTNLYDEKAYFNINNPLHISTSMGFDQSSLELISRNPKLLLMANENKETSLHVLKLKYLNNTSCIYALYEKANNEFLEAINRLDKNDETPIFNFVRLLAIGINNDCEGVNNPVIYLLNNLNHKIGDAKSYDDIGNVNKTISKATIKNKIFNELRNNTNQILANSKILYKLAEAKFKALF